MHPIRTSHLMGGVYDHCGLSCCTVHATVSIAEPYVDATDHSLGHFCHRRHRQGFVALPDHGSKHLLTYSSAKDLLIDPATRNVLSIKHVIGAAASSSSITRAEEFLKEISVPSARAYGSYKDLLRDTDIDVIYVATPHSHHYQHVKMCLEAGYNVLCEKPVTVTAAQFQSLANLAKQNGCFLMEGLWTRYFPLTQYVLDTIKLGRIGSVQRVYSDCSFAMNPEETFKDGQHRMVNPELAGGALLDLGVYSITWPFIALFLTQPANSREKPEVFSIMNKYPSEFKVDETTTMIMKFPRSAEEGGDGHAIATTSFRVSGSSSMDQNPTASVRIQGVQGEIQLFPTAQRPTMTRIFLSDGTVEERYWPQPGPGEGSGWYNGFSGWMNAEGEGQGMFWEADEVGFALIEGRKEGRFSSIEETIAVMEVLDKVREQGELQYPEAVELIGSN